MNPQTFTDEAALIEVKADELVALLQKGLMNDGQARLIRKKLINALDGTTMPPNAEAFHELEASRDRLLLSNDFEYFLSQHRLDRKEASPYITFDRVKKCVVIMAGLIMITLGLAMIIMPAPPYFEMYTVFYFNPNDGVTIMDIISLLIVFTGIYLLLSSVLKKQNTSYS